MRTRKTDGALQWWRVTMRRSYLLSTELLFLAVPLSVSTAFVITSPLWLTSPVFP